MSLLFQKPQLTGKFPLLFRFVIAISGQTRIHLKPGAPIVTIEGEAGSKFSGRLTTKGGKAISPWRMPMAKAFPEKSSTSIRQPDKDGQL